MNKKILSLSLVLAAVISLFACGSETDDLTKITDAADASDPAETGYYDSIPEDVNYNNYEFTVLSYDTRDWNLYITGDETTGDVMDVAAHRRNTEVEDMLGITIDTILVPVAELQNAFRNGVASNDADFDLACFWAVGRLDYCITENLAADWKNISEINLDKPWYNQSANEAWCINGNQYFAVSDFTYSAQQHSRILFNKNLFDKNQIDYPYDAVFDGTWTWDMMLEICKDKYVDVNNDGRQNVFDEFGLVTSKNFMLTYPHQAGERNIIVTDDGYEINMFSERIVSIVESVQALYDNPNTWMCTVDGNLQYDAFVEGRSLFETYSSDPVLLRNIDRFDFGYLPYPKYEESQEDYYSFTYGGMMAIPNVDTDYTRTGHVVEALSAASAKYIEEAFIEKSIEGKVLRDDESVEIYRMMRDNSLYEFSFYIDPSNLCGSYYGTLFAPNRPEISSLYASREQAIRTGYDQLFASFE